MEGSGVGGQRWSLKNGHLTSSSALPSLTAVLHKNGRQVGLCTEHTVLFGPLFLHIAIVGFCVHITFIDRSVWPVLCHTFVFHCLPHLCIAFFFSLFKYEIYHLYSWYQSLNWVRFRLITDCFSAGRPVACWRGLFMLQPQAALKQQHQWHVGTSCATCTPKMTWSWLMWAVSSTRSTWKQMSHSGCASLIRFNCNLIKLAETSAIKPNTAWHYPFIQL